MTDPGPGHQPLTAGLLLPATAPEGTPAAGSGELDALSVDLLPVMRALL